MPFTAPDKVKAVWAQIVQATQAGRLGWAEDETTRLRAETASVRDDAGRTIAALHADLAQARQETTRALAKTEMAEARGTGLAETLERTRTDLAAANARVDRLIEPHTTTPEADPPPAQ